MTTIKELRTNKGDTQQKLASMLGITRGAYANIEDGRREPDISTLISLADYFDVSVDYLINHERGDSTMDTLGKRIAAKREELGLSQKDLADSLSIDPAQLNYWEKDQAEPSSIMMEAIAEKLKVDVTYLKGIWQEYMYEEFDNERNPEIKLTMFNKWGVPSKLKSEYRILCRNISEKSKQPTAEDLYTIELLHLAEPEDKIAIQSILKKYENARKEPDTAG